MKVCGIVCEYNPFHNGHIHHLKEAKKICNPDVTLCVMSGNFVQRGEAAICDKWERAKYAIEYGADLVIELPFIYATQSASYFAKGSIELLKLCKITDLVFGSESNDITYLQTLADKETNEIGEFKKDGSSNTKAFEKLYGTMFANDILGINYLKALKNTNIQAHTIQRTNNYHDKEALYTLSSATSIRHKVHQKEKVDDYTPMINLDDTFKMEHYYNYMRMLLLTTPKEVLSTYFMMDEGIENLLIKNAKEAESYDEFISLSLSKRYTKTKIQRTLLHMLMHITKEEVNSLPPLSMIRPLAYNEKGQEYLKSLKKEGVNIASRFKDIKEPYRSMELKAAHVYAFPLSIKKQKEWVKKELQNPIFIPKK